MQINQRISPFRVHAYHRESFKTVTHEDLLGKWSILFFYPADFTFVCPTELVDLAEHAAELEALLEGTHEEQPHAKAALLGAAAAEPFALEPEQPARVAQPDVLPVQHGVRKQRAHRIDERLQEPVVLLGRDAGVPVADVERVIEQALPVAGELDLSAQHVHSSGFADIVLVAGKF